MRRACIVLEQQYLCDRYEDGGIQSSRSTARHASTSSARIHAVCYPDQTPAESVLLT